NVSVPAGGVPVPTSSPTDSFFDDEPTTRFPNPSDLGNMNSHLSCGNYVNQYNSSSISDSWGSYFSCANEKQGR
ncbi:hypothetical protein Tco_0491503, partial [Tanacetum coccineum]